MVVPMDLDPHERMGSGVCRVLGAGLGACAVTPPIRSLESSTERRPRVVFDAKTGRASWSSWSPDRCAIVLAHRILGGWRLAVGEAARHPEWSKDGRFIVYDSARRKIKVLEVFGQPRTPEAWSRCLFAQNDVAPMVPPDQPVRWMASSRGRKASLP